MTKSEFSNVTVSPGRYHSGLSSRQRGVVLVISLLLLLVLTIIGIGLMNSTIMQERMAGNVRTQVLSFEEASGGVSKALDFFYEYIEDAMVDNSVSDPYGYGMACGFRHGDEDMHWDYPADGSFLNVEENDRMRLDQRMYCCQNWVYDEELDQCYETPSTLFVLSRGSFLDHDGDGRLASREIEVRLEESEPGEPTCAICLPGNLGELNPPRAGGGVHGGCGPAITIEDPADAQQIEDSWASNSNSELTGGVAAGEVMPWGDPLAVAEFVFWAKLGGPFRDDVPVEYIFDDDIPGGTGYTGNPSFGDLDNPQITYFDNHSKTVRFQGTPSGAGIMIIRGDVNFGGTPDFEGLIVILGGQFRTGAGGGRGGIEGSMIVTDLEIGADTGDYDYLGRPEVLRYPVAKDSDGNVEMFYSDYYEQDIPVLETDSTKEQLPWGDYEVYFGGYDGSGDLIFLDEPGGSPQAWEWEGVPYESDVLFGAPPYDMSTPRMRFGNDSDTVPRDKFGRLIPDFLAVENWPPLEYGYSPNEWRWSPDPNPFGFNEDGSNLLWPAGGGNQAINYDCRMLHRMRHRLLCEEKHPDHDPTLDVDDDFYDDPDYASVCNHHTAEYEYWHEDDIHNQFAWHLWQPSCECMGITVETDMILSGWRENIGWRDEGNFVGCESLTKSVRCPE